VKPGLGCDSVAATEVCLSYVPVDSQWRPFFGCLAAWTSMPPRDLRSIPGVTAYVGTLELNRPDERPELSPAGTVDSRLSLDGRQPKRRHYMTNETSHADTDHRKNGPVDPGTVEATVQDAVRKLGTQAAEVGEQVYRQAVDAGRYAGRQVEEQPWAAALVTGLLGLAVGILLGRSSVPPPRTARDYVDEYLPRKLRQR